MENKIIKTIKEKLKSNKELFGIMGSGQVVSILQETPEFKAIPIYGIYEKEPIDLISLNPRKIGVYTFNEKDYDVWFDPKLIWENTTITYL